MSEVNIGQNIRKQREKIGLTQKELAEKMYVGESTVQKWEVCKTMPKFPTILELIKIFNVDIKELCPSLDNVRLLDKLEVYDENAAKTILYTGIEETCAGYNAFHKDSSIILNCECKVGFIDEEFGKESWYSWANKNRFLFMVNKTTKEIYGIRDFGMYRPEAEQLLFSTDYIPFKMTPMLHSMEDIKEQAEKIINLYNDEMKRISKYSMNGKKPLYIFAYLGVNNYAAWSMEEEKCMFVYGYKSYRASCAVSDITCTKKEDILHNHDYVIITPGKEFIENTGLLLDSFTWNHKLTWDKWEKRDEKISIVTEENLDKNIFKCYSAALKLINKSRVQNLGYDEDFEKLEKRITTLENLIKLDAPLQILENQADLINTLISDINI